MCHNQSNHTWYVHHHTHSFNIILKSRTVMTSWRSALFQSFQMTAPNNCENAEYRYIIPIHSTLFWNGELGGSVNFFKDDYWQYRFWPSMSWTQQILWLEVTYIEILDIQIPKTINKLESPFPNKQVIIALNFNMDISERFSSTWKRQAIFSPLL